MIQLAVGPLTLEVPTTEGLSTNDSNTQVSGWALQYFQIVMDQTRCSQQQAIDALIKHNGDVVDAIMSVVLTLSKNYLM